LLTLRAMFGEYLASHGVQHAACSDQNGNLVVRERTKAGNVQPHVGHGDGLRAHLARSYLELAGAPTVPILASEVSA
jgi:hypothetical protein